MRDEDALLAIEDLSNQDLSSVKNVSAYFKSVCRRRNTSANDAGGQSGSFPGVYGQQQQQFAGYGQQQQGQEQGHAYNPALADVQNALMRGVITPMVGTAMERLFSSNPGVQFDAAAWDEFTQLNEMSAMNAIDETFVALQETQVRNPNGLFVSKVRKFLQIMRGGGGGRGGFDRRGGYGGRGGGGGGGQFFNIGGSGTDDQTMHDMLPPDVSSRIIACLERGVFPRSAVDERVIQNLSRLDQDSMGRVLDEMEHCDTSQIRNVASYFMGIIRKQRGGGGGGGRGFGVRD